MKFPLFIDIENKPVLVAGGGNIAVRRINTLLLFGADITVAAPELKDGVKGSITHIKRTFEPDDINGKFLVVAATDDRAVNHRIYELCTEKGIYISTADNREECSFYFPAVCVTDKLCAGLVSDGSDHKLVSETAEKIRRLLADE